MLELMCLHAQLLKLSQKPALIMTNRHGNNTGTDRDKKEPWNKDLAQLFISDTEDEDFDGIVDTDWWLMF